MLAYAKALVFLCISVLMKEYLGVGQFPKAKKLLVQILNDFTGDESINFHTNSPIIYFKCTLVFIFRKSPNKFSHCRDLSIS